MVVSICIANYKQDQYLPELFKSINRQIYSNKEIVVYHDTEGIGSGEAFNRAIEKSIGDIVILMCADDVFTDPHVISDIVEVFKYSPDIRHVSRWYYQFVDYPKRDRNFSGYQRFPVRAWRGDNVIELANNPSGLAFRKSSIGEHRLTNKMFVEAPALVQKVCQGGWYHILPYDTVAVRIHKSTARSPEYYKKMWKSSPVEEWSKLGWATNDFTHLIQVGVNFEKKAVAQEACQFLNLNHWNLFNPVFWFFFLVALWTPRRILYHIPELYRSTFGRWFTREVKRQ